MYLQLEYPVFSSLRQPAPTLTVVVVVGGFDDGGGGGGGGGGDIGYRGGKGGSCNKSEKHAQVWLVVLVNYLALGHGVGSIGR